MFGKKARKIEQQTEALDRLWFINLQQTEILKATLEREERLLDELARLKGEVRNGNNQ
ncbi:hypothetical protein O3602_09180 [Streptococcus sp. 27098_8_186]|uniref:hypothetical protein n=1 Tax=Streptococcus sp. 27098_8_186 TaxID=3003650 RepID=UPI00352D8BA2